MLPQVGQEKGQVEGNYWLLLQPAFPPRTHGAGFGLGMPAFFRGPGGLLGTWLGHFSPNLLPPVLKKWSWGVLSRRVEMLF